jgi:hypothetical protein
MTTQLNALTIAALLGSLLALSGQRNAEAQVPVQPPQQTQPQDPEETEEEKERKRKKKQQQEQAQEEQQKKQQAQEERNRQQQAPADRPPPPRQQTPEERQKQAQENERQEQVQKQQERELQQKRAQQERNLPKKRVSQEDQRERIRWQEQQLALYRKNIALREELAERDQQILRQQKRIQHLRFQQQYEERLRAQRAQLMQARYDYYNDPFYYTAPNYRYHRGGRYFTTNQYGIRQLERAMQAGYNEGYRAGRADREDRWRYDPRAAFAYRDANFGYDGRYIAQDEYNHYFREGFVRGYEDGYYGRQKYGRRNDDGGINEEWLIAGAVVAAIIGYEVLTD